MNSHPLFSVLYYHQLYDFRQEEEPHETPICPGSRGHGDEHDLESQTPLKGG